MCKESVTSYVAVINTSDQIKRANDGFIQRNSLPESVALNENKSIEFRAIYRVILLLEQLLPRIFVAFHVAISFIPQLIFI